MNTLLVFALMLLPIACRSVPAAPSPLAQQVHTHSASASGDGYVQLSINGDHGALLLVMHGDRFTGILDGDVLPADRLVRDGDKLTVKGADGSALYEVRVLPDEHGMYYPYSGSQAKVYAGDLGNGAYTLSDFADGASDSGFWRVAPSNRKVIGVSTGSVSAALREQLGLQGDAFVLDSVNADMPAARAGAKPFDIVTAIDGQAGATVEKLRTAIDAKKAGDTLTLTVLRKGQSQDLSLTLEDPKPGAGYAVSGFGSSGPTTWSFNTNDADNFKTLAEQEQASDKARTELAEKLAAIQADTEKLGAAQSGEAARKLADLAKRQAELAEQMRTEAASAMASGTYGLLQAGEGGSRVLVLPRGTGAGGAAAAGPADAGISSDRLAALEARLAKLEALLERIAPQAAAGNDSKSGEAPGSKP